MCKAFLLHMSMALDTIKKQGRFKVYAKAHELYVEQCNLAKQAKALWLSLTKPLARVQELPRSLPRRPMKVWLRLTHLTPKCALSEEEQY
jgi:hypothetical protein